MSGAGAGCVLSAGPCPPAAAGAGSRRPGRRGPGRSAHVMGYAHGLIVGVGPAQARADLAGAGPVLEQGHHLGAQDGIGVEPPGLGAGQALLGRRRGSRGPVDLVRAGVAGDLP